MFEALTVLIISLIEIFEETKKGAELVGRWLDPNRDRRLIRMNDNRPR